MGRGSTLAAVRAPACPFSRNLDSRLAMLARQLIASLKQGQIVQVAYIVDQIAGPTASEDRVRRVLGLYAAGVLECLRLKRGTLGPVETMEIEARLARAYADDGWVIQAMSAQREAEGSRHEAMGLYDGLADSADGAGAALLHAATLAGNLGTWDKALTFGRRAVAIAGNDRPLITAVGALFLEHDRAVDAVTCWRVADAAGRPRLWVRQGIGAVVSSGPTTTRRGRTKPFAACATHCRWRSCPRRNRTI